jgi:pantoate kinase
MRAHAPGSLTGLYAPPPTDTPEAASRGASVAIEDGVTVEVAPAHATVVTLEGERVDFEPVERLLADLGVTASVSVEPDVPIGHGFGASGAATLATALAADAEFDLGHARDDLVAAAHRAELAAGTGQGDVFIQDRGGLLWSGADGPNRRELDGTVGWASGGSIETASVLADENFRMAAARSGPTHLAALDEAPSLRSFVERSRDFLAATDLATPYVAERIERVEAAGGAASMALFGETVFAIGADGVLANRTAVSNVGARILGD